MSENSPSPMAAEGGGPPSDAGNSTIVTLDKTNAPPPAPAAPPPAAKVEPPPAPAPAPAPKPATEAVDPPAKPAQKTLADPPPGEEPKVQTPADWPDDWRVKMAGDDKKLLARLERMGSPKDILNSWRAMEQRLSSGELKRALPNNYTEEELAEYRKSNGIPEKPEDYDTALGNGFVWGEADQPLLKDFTAFAHERNMPADTVKSALEWFARQQQNIVDEVAMRDQRELAQGSEALRAEWGNGYKGNLTAVRNLLEGQTAATPDGEAIPMFDLLMSARAEDGRRLGNIPDVLKWASGLSRELNPFATLVPDQAGGNSGIKAAEAEFAAISAKMGDKSSDYWRGPNSETIQARWRELHGLLEKAKARAA